MLVYRMSAIDASSAMAKVPLASVVGAFPDGRDNWLGAAPRPARKRHVRSDKPDSLMNSHVTCHRKKKRV